MKNYRTPLAIPEGKSGKLQIKHRIHPAGAKVILGNFRTQILGGQKGPHAIVYDTPTLWHELYEEDQGTWMTDLPIEQRQHDEILKPIRSGRVLIGGLGLGYAATRLAARKHISKITVVEISQDVINLVRPYLPSGIEVVCADLHQYLKGTKEKFDWAYYDIWQSDGEATFFKTVCPLIESSHGVVKHRPICWNEDVMRGQLFHGILSRVFVIDHDPTGKSPDEVLDFLTTPENIWVNWSIPFFKWYREHRKQDWQERARLYVQFYGLGDYGLPKELADRMYGEGAYETDKRERTQNSGRLSLSR